MCTFSVLRQLIGVVHDLVSPERDLEKNRGVETVWLTVATDAAHRQMRLIAAHVLQVRDAGGRRNGDQVARDVFRLLPAATRFAPPVLGPGREIGKTSRT